MRTLASALLLIAVTASAKEVHKALPLAANGNVSVETHNGSITVTTWNQPSVDVVARIEPSPDWSAHASDVDHTDILVKGGGASVSIETDYSRVPERFFMQGPLPLVHYTIRVPATAQLRVVNHNAATRVTGLRGDVRIRTHNGATTLRNLGGAADVESHNGDVEVEFDQFARPSRFSTHNGDVAVALPANARFSVHSVAHHAHISSDFPMTQHVSGDVVTASVNGGGPELRISAHNGALMLRRR